MRLCRWFKSFLMESKDPLTHCGLVTAYWWVSARKTWLQCVSNGVSLSCTHPSIWRHRSEPLPEPGLTYQWGPVKKASGFLVDARICCEGLAKWWSYSSADSRAATIRPYLMLGLISRHHTIHLGLAVNTMTSFTPCHNQQWSCPRIKASENFITMLSSHLYISEQ